MRQEGEDGGVGGGGWGRGRMRMGAWEDGGVGGGGRASGRKGAGTDKVEEQKRETDKGSELPERRGGGKVAMKAGSEKSKRQRLANEKCKKEAMF